MNTPAPDLALDRMALVHGCRTHAASKGSAKLRELVFVVGIPLKRIAAASGAPTGLVVKWLTGELFPTHERREALEAFGIDRQHWCNGVKRGAKHAA